MTDESVKLVKNLGDRDRFIYVFIWYDSGEQTGKLLVRDRGVGLAKDTWEREI